MKKVLFATSALIATASVAAADVTLTGSGRFGIVYQDGDFFGGPAAANYSSTKIEKRMTINIDGSGSTDTGFDFGGRIRLRSDEGEGAGSAQSSANIYFGNDSFRVTVGNTDGAALNRMNYFAGSLGLTGMNYRDVSFNIGSSNWVLDSFSSRGTTGPDVVRLDFNVGGFGASISTSSTGDFTSNGHQDSIAVNYNFGDWVVAAAYTNVDFATARTAVVSPAIATTASAPGLVGKLDQKIISASINGSIGDFGVGLAYTDQEWVGNKVVLSGNYDFGDTSVQAFVAKTSEDTVGSAGIGVNGEEVEYGIGFTHSLGGATLAGGIVSDYRDTIGADLGIRFSF